MEEKEKRIRGITQLYYTNPSIQKAILEFSRNREVVPRYMVGFGKRPDIIQYENDIVNLVKKGATSFHVSEEIWENPLDIESDMKREELDEMRAAWDLLIDIDSPYLDCSKIAAKLIISALEHHGIKNFGIKFSGSKGFHIIVPSKAFPENFEGKETKMMFPEWPRAISEYLMEFIRKEYNLEAGKILSGKAMELAGLKKTDSNVVRCRCGREAKRGFVAVFKCPICGMEVNRRDIKITKRRLKCLSNVCAGVLEVKDKKEYYFCEYCKDPENEKMQLNSDKHPESFVEHRGVNVEKIAKLDLVLVAPRHLFRAPYSLHEKTTLASAVIEKTEIDGFSPRDADPMKIKIRDFLPKSVPGEAKKLLGEAISWKKKRSKEDEELIEKKYKSYSEIEISGVVEEDFPNPIKKILKGVNDGKKRALFILITFFRTLNFSPEYINKNIRDWNEKNEPPLKEGYIRSQIEWHLRQRKKILPPNYNNESFYSDLGVLDEKNNFKNPISEVLWKKSRRK